MTDRTAFSIFESLTEVWCLSDHERATLLNIDLTKYDELHRASEGVRLSLDQAHRVSYLINIYDATHRIFGDSEYANDWIHRTNPDLSGRVPLSVMLEGDLDGIVSVHDHLQRIVANY